MTITDDIEEFMGIPYLDVVKQVGDSGSEYLKKVIADMFPWGVKEGDRWDFYRSDRYSAYLFWKVVKEMEDNSQHIPQRFANIAEGHYTQPRILIYGCGTGLDALTLRMMHLENEQANFQDITLADVPGKYFEFLTFMSEKYGLGFKFIPLEKGKECLDKRYDLIIFNNAFGQDPITTLHHLVDHLEEMQHIYLNAVTLTESSYRYPDLVKVEGMGLQADHPDCGAWRIWQKKLIVLPQQEDVKVPAKEKGDRIFPASIACLSSLPGTACGISTYTNMLSQAISKYYPVSIFRDINHNVPKDALILSSIEFGIFEKTSMLLNPAYESNYKVAIWHTVLRNPVGEYLKYIHEIDADYDVHIVHTVVQKTWLSKYVSKPVHIIPHGTMVWDPVPASEAKEKLGLPENMIIAFMFGFAADNKGLEEIISFSKTLKIPNFKLVMSAGVNTASKEAAEYTGHIQDYLRRATKDTNVMVLGKYLNEDEINLWASAADVLIFNYKTPPYVGSASGAMKRVLAAGKPIICVNDNRLEELVDGQHCLKFHAGDLDEFARCITTLLSDKEMADKLGKNCRMLAEQTSWDRTVEKLLQLIGETVKGFGQEYYDEEYFAGRQGGKTYAGAEGEEKKWSYYNPDGEWLGAEHVIKGIKEILNPENMLSVGEGRGTFCAYAQAAGINSKGIDFSRWAIEHPYPRAKGLLELGDVRDLKFEDKSFELVFCSDIMEHIYLDDLPNAISEIQRVAKKWIFYNIGASMADDRNGDLIVEKNRLPPKERLVTTVAGHVTVKSEAWWKERLACDGWVFRDDLVAKFREIVPTLVLSNWKCIILMERTG